MKNGKFFCYLDFFREINFVESIIPQIAFQTNFKVLYFELGTFQSFYCLPLPKMISRKNQCQEINPSKWMKYLFFSILISQRLILLYFNLTSNVKQSVHTRISSIRRAIEADERRNDFCYIHSSRIQMSKWVVILAKTRLRLTNDYKTIKEVIRKNEYNPFKYVSNSDKPNFRLKKFTILK